MRIEEALGKMVDFPFFMFVIFALSKARYPRKMTAACMLAVAALYVLATYGVIHRWYAIIYTYPALDLAYQIVHILFMALTALLLTRQRIVQSLFIIASTYVTITVTGVLSVACLLMWRVPELAAKCVLYLILCLLIYRARKPFAAILGQTKKGWWLLCSVPMFLIVNFLLISAIPVTLSRNPTRLLAALILCGTTVIIYITFFYMIWELKKQNQLEQNVIALRLSVLALEHQNELIQENERQYALFRHDLRHYTRLIMDCLDRDDAQSARALLSSLDSTGARVWVQGGAPRFSGHALWDALVNRYAAQARAMGIDITIRADTIRPLKADETETAVVLANALENAVKACQGIPDGEPRVIRIDGKRRGAQYFLEIVNTYAGQVTIDPDTGLPLSAGLRRGLGCQSIAFFAQKYGAALQFQAEDGWFHLRLLL